MAAGLPFRDINVHASASHYAFTSPSSPLAPTLVVERPSGDLRLNDGALLGAKRVSSIAGILGIIKLRLDKYIIVITKAQPMGRLKGHMIYRIVATEFLALRERPLHDLDEDSQLSLLKNLLASGPMYFSYTFDLTNAFQRQAHVDVRVPLWKRADDRFFWNRFVQTDLIDFRGGGGGGSGLRQSGPQQPGVDPYILPVMFGMLRISPTRVRSTPLTFILITRRSRHRVGTRYFSRGIDEKGQVSNYNETEQVVILNDSAAGHEGFSSGADGAGGAGSNRIGAETQVLSYVQIRGSVPVYWAEVNNLHYTPKLQIRGVDTALDAARRHFEEQMAIYGDVHLVNLVNQKGREAQVKSAYEQVVRSLVATPAESKRGDNLSAEKLHTIEPGRSGSGLDRLHYVYFDFHNETKGLRWHRAQVLLDQMLEALRRQQYFRGVDMPGDASGQLEVRNMQTSVVRTNCMDCLDRTNLVQSMLAQWTLDRQLQDVGVLQQQGSVSEDGSFQHLFRNVWADNADVVSKSYSGTGALKTDFTRTGQRTRRGMVQDGQNSLTRYVRNNFGDGPRQDGFDLFLGAYLPSATSSASAGGLLFVDRRPLLVQAIPYILAASLLMIVLALMTPRMPDSATLPLRIFVACWMAVGGWCAYFIYGHGALYVNWPKLNALPWASEAYNEAMGKVRKDHVIGSLVHRHERGASTARLHHLEEGKKRIE